MATKKPAAKKTAAKKTVAKKPAAKKTVSNKDTVSLAGKTYTVDPERGHRVVP